MQPIDGITSQLAMCCGLGRRRDHRFMDPMAGPPIGGYYYSPSMAHMGAGNTWPMAAGFHQPMALAPQAQPYFLLTQPVIIASNPTAPASNTASAMTLVHQNTIGGGGGGGPRALLATTGASPISSANQQANSMMSSQYAIYNPTTGALNVQQQQQQAIYSTQDGVQINNSRLIQNRSTYFDRPQQQAAPINHQAYHQTNKHTNVPLTAETFKKLELIEKQVDLSKDMDLIERHEIVITRAIDPNSLMPHLTEATLRKYHSYFLFNDDYVIRFIEIIKRPGQTLGLYIRSVQFENIQLRSSREGLVITRIESDSPIYNSQVLHVGDEILSINLVEVQGMSLDDVVIIMSIPKRLVLALRIPRERDQLLKSNLIQQQQLAMRMSRMSMKAEQESPFSQQQRQNIQQSPSSRMVGLNGTNNMPRDQSYQANSGNNIVGEPYQTTGTPGGGQANANQLDSSTLFHARPVKVGSASQLDHLLNAGVIDDEDQDEARVRRRQQVADGHRALDEYRRHGSGGDYRFPSRYITSSAGIGQHGFSSHQQQQQQQQLQQQQHQIGEEFERPGDFVLDKTGLASNSGARIGHMDRQMAISGSVDESRLDTDMANGRYQTNYAIDQELATLEREAMNKDRHVFGDTMGGLQSSSLANDVDPNNNTTAAAPETANQHHQMPSTLPRRTLPTRPDMISPGLTSTTAAINLGSPIKQPNVISNIRLGQTPEQSSYFSSSIDAINRELKELRRQRMALSNNEPTGGSQIT